MGTRGNCHLFVRTCVYLTLFVIYTFAQETCDKTVCSGPVRYYTDLGCTPIYANPNDCCAEKYNCSFVNNLSKNKCYVNDHEYSFGEVLRDEDAGPCDALCTCEEDLNAPGIGSFVCAGLDCAFLGSTSQCYYKHSHDECCPESYVCLEEGEERPTCEVDGTIYKDGEAFVSKFEPEKDCYCMSGYEGKNVEPFCKKPKRPKCSPLFRDAYAVHQNCAPIFYDNMVPQTDCNIGFICPNENDTVIHNHDSNESVSEEDSDICLFGDLILHIGDELDQKTSPCMKCICEAPPTLTCQQLPTDNCNEEVTIYTP